MKMACLAAAWMLSLATGGWAVDARGEDAAPGLDLTAEEQAWLAAQPEIRVGVMTAWPPFDYVGSAGVPQGIGIDLLASLNQTLGGRLRAVPGMRSEIYEDCRKGRLEAVLDVPPRPDREAYLIFTRPYARIPHAIIARKGTGIFDSYQSLRKRRVAVEQGFYAATYMREHHPRIKVTEYPSTIQALVAVSSGKADAYIGNQVVAEWFIDHEYLTRLEVQGEARATSTVNSIGVRRDLPLLASILDKALARLPAVDLQTIFARWGSDAFLPAP